MNGVRFVVAFVATLVAGPWGAMAQTPGNIIAVNSTGAIFEVSASSVTTLGRIPGGQLPRGVTMSIDNRAVVILTDQTGTRVRSLRLLEWRAGVLSTLGVATVPAGPVSLLSDGGVIVDQRGDYIAASPLGVIRYAGVGGVATTLIRTAFSGISEDLTTGGWLGFNGAALSRISRGGRVSPVVTIPGPVAVGNGDVITDTVNGDALLFRAGSLLRAALPGGQLTTLLQAKVICGDILPPSRALVLGSSIGVLRADRQGQNVSTIGQVQNGVNALTVFGSRHVAGFGPSTPGSLFTVLASFPRWPNRGYQLAMSLGFRPGIPTPAGVIPLAPDPLFYLSQRAPSLFVNFGGTLDAQGEAIATVRIPNARALIGLLIYYGGVSYDQTGILTIAEPATLLIE